MLLTINGEADNGKDFVADWCANRFGLVKIALADPMKRFAAALFGFSDDNLWGPSEKRNELLDAQPMWARALSQINIIHLFTVAVVPETLGVDTRVRAFNGLQNWFTQLRRQYPTELSARIVLQTLGTEWGRDVDPNLWISYLFNTQLPLLVAGHQYTPRLGIHLDEEPGEVKNGIVIPDQRFSNELEACHARSGYSVRVRRLSRVKTDNSNVGIKGHASEQEQRSIPDACFSKVFEFPEGLDSVVNMLETWSYTLNRAENDPLLKVAHANAASST